MVTQTGGGIEFLKAAETGRDRVPTGTRESKTVQQRKTKDLLCDGQLQFFAQLFQTAEVFLKRHLGFDTGFP
ncbi:hypothetical protein [Rosistilla oblonga]|uniref:Uncharacterized protein n=1 Tax=Rosistilla oblonga TaxID=2527990 RepID=A0A518IWY6_9BACT|nr:hypothetical protein [Rosistilla oblonga]QDV57604.1 hypothetical protein Mal33_36170 [Rosistilla oblonga]